MTEIELLLMEKLAAKETPADTDTMIVAEGNVLKKSTIAQLNNGDTVEVIEKKDSTYWYVYVPKLGKEGYVDKNYLK